MKTVTLKQLKDELSYKSANELKDLCLHLSKFKKENKELLTYLLFEFHNEESYVESVKFQIAVQFAEIKTKNFFFHQKISSKNFDTNEKIHSIFKEKRN